MSEVTEPGYDDGSSSTTCHVEVGMSAGVKVVVVLALVALLLVVVLTDNNKPNSSTFH